MAYHPLLQTAGYAPKPYQGMTPQEVIAQAIEQRKAEDAHQAADIANKEAGMTLEENQTLHPMVMSQLAQEANPSPQSASGGLPVMQAATGSDDPYAAQQRILDEQKRLADFASGHPLMMSMSPRIAAIQKAKEDALQGQSGIATGNYNLGLKREWEGLKPQLDAIMTPPPKGWNPLNGGKAAALAKAQASIPAHLQNLPEVKDWFQNAAKEQQNTVFNMAGPEAKVGSALMTDFRGERKDYEDKTSGYLNAEGIVNANTFGKNRIGDISLLDQMARAETGSKPTEAQYHEFKSQPGVLGMIGAAYERLGNGRLLLPEDVNAIMQELRSQQAIRHENYARTVQTYQDQARGLGVSTNFVNPGGIYQQVESKWKPKWAAEGGAAPAGGKGSSKESPADAKDKAAYDALPPGTWYKGPSGHIAQKPGKP